MGNCVKIRATTTTSPENNEVPEVVNRPEGDGNGNGLKVKVLLTRGELEWLMAQLKNGEKRLVEVLAEMGKEREREKAKYEGWKPSLESIVESPELKEVTFD